MLELLFVSDKHINQQLFGRLFRMVARVVKGQWRVVLRWRWVVHLPSHDEEVRARITKIYKEAVKDIRMPTGLRTWLMHSLVCIPTAGNKTSTAAAGTAFSKATPWTAMVLNELCPIAPALEFPDSRGAFRVPETVDIEAVKAVVLPPLK